ncbi:unnamed protein product [Brassicogethes aeneus]|uniref:Anti-proliferative protein domain-containing protein n=1 Tax=Brassicogethes aeneus TaxID=1431903 RepID=A0A9P0FAK7_BRAAE|nr:unnamed protein product [Brassicogethes aeneus]
MKEEILAAVMFFIRFIEKSETFPREQLENFKRHLTDLLEERFNQHWFPEVPTKGQGYRCIRVNGVSPIDLTLERAASKCGLSYRDLRLPQELTVWVDPSEVCYRLGESEGSYCTLATFPSETSSLASSLASSLGGSSSASSESAGSTPTHSPPSTPHTTHQDKITSPMQTTAKKVQNNKQLASSHPNQRFASSMEYYHTQQQQKYRNHSNMHGVPSSLRVKQSPREGGHIDRLKENTIDTLAMMA